MRRLYLPHARRAFFSACAGHASPASRPGQDGTHTQQAPQARRDAAMRRSCTDISRSLRKSQRQSRPAAVLAALDSAAKDRYWLETPGKMDLSYNTPHRLDSRKRRQPLESVPAQRLQHSLPEPVSLYSILTRYLVHQRAAPHTDVDVDWTRWELALLASRGYTPDSVRKWALCLTEPNSQAAAQLFDARTDVPPLFLLLMFLRRKQIRLVALATVLKHIEYRAKAVPISWNDFKILVVRLLRHARMVWPESMPWIATLFTTEAARLHNGQLRAVRPLPGLLQDVTKVCNTVLSLLSLPTASHPILCAKFQEKAQFQVLQYMANCSPAIAVTRVGFQAVARNQLAHPKSQQEREWAELKGAGWPPWKENRTAMDEDKAYEFGSSRASRILHRMYEAGYGGGLWEDIAQLYAGWDTDFSPTIQTRTLGPGFRTPQNDLPHLRALLWAGRIRTTRTRREAWACFLSHEMTNEPSHQELYLAMFEKLHYPLATRASSSSFQAESARIGDGQAAMLLPGDTLEVLPDPVSPLHYVFLSEPVPTYMELLHRMRISGIRPSRRLLAFLLETCPDFDTGLDVIHDADDGPDRPLSCLIAGNHAHEDIIRAIPGFLFAAFIRFLCRFGHFEHVYPRELALRTGQEHELYFNTRRNYLVEYAYALLLHYKPRYRPAWTAYIQRLVKCNGPTAGNISRYKHVCQVVQQMEQVDLDLDDETFLPLCTATLYAAQSVEQGQASLQDKHYLFATASPRLRTLFNHLVTAGLESHAQPPFSSTATTTTNTNTNTNTPPAHIPGPASLHAYVRALGALCDYEGLYSLSSWMARHSEQVTARAEAQHSGSKMLFRTLVALRVAVEGPSEQSWRAPADIAQLIRAQIASVEAWGGWPSRNYVELYVKGQLTTAAPVVGGR